MLEDCIPSPGTISDFTAIRSLETCPIFLVKEHWKLFVGVAVILSNLGQAEVKCRENSHIKGGRGERIPGPHTSHGQGVGCRDDGG